MYGAWTIGDLGLYTINSVIYTATATTVTVFLALGAGYGFAKFGFRISKYLHTFFVMGLLVTAHSVLVPLFILETRLGIDDTRLGVLIPYVGFGLPFMVYLATSFIRGIPDSLEEVARIDGAGYLSIFWHVIRPISAPVVATMTIFSFVANWNEFVFVFVLTSSQRLRSLPVGVNAFAGGQSRDFGLLFAAPGDCDRADDSLLRLLSRAVEKGICRRGDQGIGEASRLPGVFTVKGGEGRCRSLSRRRRLKSRSPPPLTSRRVPAGMPRIATVWMGTAPGGRRRSLSRPFRPEVALAAAPPPPGVYPPGCRVSQRYGWGRLREDGVDHSAGRSGRKSRSPPPPTSRRVPAGVPPIATVWLGTAPGGTAAFLVSALCRCGDGTLRFQLHRRTRFDGEAARTGLDLQRSGVLTIGGDLHRRTSRVGIGRDCDRNSTPPTV